MSEKAPNTDESPPPYTPKKGDLDATDQSEVKAEEPSAKLTSLEVPPKESRASTYFVFGRLGQFYYTNFENSIWKCTTALQRADIKVPYSIALGDASCYFIAGESNAKSATWSCERVPVSVPLRSKAKQEYNEDDSAEQRWNAWFNQISTKPSECCHTVVAFGAGRSFYAASSIACTWHGIPTQMASQIEDRWSSSSTRPRHVTLGHKGTYVLIWPDGSIDYHLNNLYVGLATQLSSTTRKAVSFIALNPFSSTDFYIEYADGLILYCIAEATPENRERIKMLRNATMQKRATKDVMTWTTQILVGNGKEMFTISPDTNYTFDLAVVKERIKEEDARKAQTDAAKAKKNSSTAKKLGVAAVAIATCVVM